MKFELSYKIGDRRVQVIFKTLLPLDAIQSLFQVFEKIGGITENKGCNIWSFPTFITSDIIQEIIHNTCFVCGGLMQDGQALDNTWVGSEDFGGDYGQPGTTISKIGQPVMRVVRKCSSCGHSHT